MAESTAPTLMQVPAQILDFKPRADRSYRLVFETRQLTGTEVAMLADNFQGEGWLVFKPNSAIEMDEIPSADADAGIESPSIKLRKRLYVLWVQKGKQGSFENFYLDAMAKFMQYVEEKLEPGS